MALQHPVLSAKMTVAETAVSDDSLCGILAVLRLALDLLWCAATEWESKMECAFFRDGIVRQSGRRRCEMLAGKDEAQIL